MINLDPLFLTLRACLYTASSLLGGCGMVALYGVCRGHLDAALWGAILIAAASLLVMFLHREPIL